MIDTLYIYILRYEQKWFILNFYADCVVWYERNHNWWWIFLYYVSVYSSISHLNSYNSRFQTLIIGKIITFNNHSATKNLIPLALMHLLCLSYRIFHIHIHLPLGLVSAHQFYVFQWMYVKMMNGIEYASHPFEAFPIWFCYNNFWYYYYLYYLAFRLKWFAKRGYTKTADMGKPAHVGVARELKRLRDSIYLWLIYLIDI